MSSYCLYARTPYRVGLHQHRLLADLHSFQNGILWIKTNLGLIVLYDGEHSRQFFQRIIKNYVFYGRKSQAFGSFFNTLYLKVCGYQQLKNKCGIPQFLRNRQLRNSCGNQQFYILRSANSAFAESRTQKVLESGYGNDEHPVVCVCISIFSYPCNKEMFAN